MLLCTLASAQVNVQFHYDLGRSLYTEREANRPNVTTTVEMFRPDKLGSTFFSCWYASSSAATSSSTVPRRWPLRLASATPSSV